MEHWEAMIEKLEAPEVKKRLAELYGQELEKP